jgi:hypothetical protein
MGDEKCVQNCGEKSEGKRVLGIPRRVQEDNIKTGLRE